MPILSYFGVMTPLLLFALFVAAALLHPKAANPDNQEIRSTHSISAQRDVKPEMFDRLKALRIDK